jgi:peptidoglycan/xylan/chitin deacetylase (PgdA/CDA1 family)
MSNSKKRDDDKWADLKPGDDKWTHHKPGDDDSGDDGFGDGKTVVLSFDDGPAPTGALKDILKTLRHEDIKGEFFVIGSEVE